MKKLNFLFALALCFAVIFTSNQHLLAQKKINKSGFNKTLPQKYHYLDIPSFNTLGQKDTYIPLFVENYYEIKDGFFVENALWYSSASNKYTTKTAGNATYTEKDFSSIFETKIPLALFKTKDEEGNPVKWQVVKDENTDWKKMWKDDKGIFKVYAKYKKPIFKIAYRLEKDKDYTYTQYNMRSEKTPEVDTRQTNGYLQHIEFDSQKEAEDFLKKLLTELK